MYLEFILPSILKKITLNIDIISKYRLTCVFLYVIIIAHKQNQGKKIAGKMQKDISVATIIFEINLLCFFTQPQLLHNIDSIIQIL